MKNKKKKSYRTLPGIALSLTLKDKSKALKPN